MSTHHIFKFECELASGGSLPVMASSEDIKEFIVTNYPEVPLSHYMTFFSNLVGAELLDPLLPSKKKDWELPVRDEDVLWVTAKGGTIREAFLQAREEAQSLPGEDGFMRLFKRYFVIDGRSKTLESALALIPTYSAQKTGTRAVGVTVLSQGHFLFYTQRHFYTQRLRMAEMLNAD